MAYSKIHEITVKVKFDIEIDQTAAAREFKEATLGIFTVGANSAAKTMRVGAVMKTKRVTTGGPSK